MAQTKPSCRLYLITPPKLVWDSFENQLKAALSAGDVGCMQLRLKDAPDDEIIEIARQMLPICHEHDVAFILNDRPDLARQCGADGVHLGQEDMNPTEARKILGDDAVIGVSCHASRHMAMVAGEEGADYVAFGAFYPTTSKPQEKIDKWGVPSPDILSWWQEMTEIPCVAIGGITADNCVPLVKAGADFIAAITYVWGHAQGPGAAVKQLNTAIEQVLN